jgi:hypothetical protein
MKIYIQIVALYIALFCSNTLHAQSSDDVGKIALSVVIPENVDGLTPAQLSKLETKIIQIVTNSGLAASGYNHNFVIYPKLAVYENNVVEGGMQNITVITGELSLYVKQVDNNLLFSSVGKSLKGSGKSKEMAITNAISQIPVEYKDFQLFFETGKQKIVKYYEENCNDIQKKADTYIKLQQYEQALGLLMSIPEEVSSCYNSILDKATNVYKAYQKQKCSDQIQQAKTKSAAMNYIDALNILAEIDPSTDCFKDAQSLIKSIEGKVNAEEKKQWNLQIKTYNDAVNLEKHRIDAIKEIAVSYYKSKPSSVNYHYLIK